jgi:hypothetical protein
MMPWHDHATVAHPERGRPWPRLVRGILWAVLALFVISILAFWAGRILAEQALDNFRSIMLLLPALSQP